MEEETHDSMLKPRALHTSEWPRLQELLQAVHQRSTPESYCAEYPLMLSPDRASSLFVISHKVGGPLLCHVGTLERVANFGSLRLPVALIGSVATHPSARGHGLARRTLERVHTELRQRGVLLTMLWSDHRTLYYQLGYRPVGASLLFRVTPTPTIQPSLSCRPIREMDRDAIRPLLARRASSLERTDLEHDRLSRIEGVEGYVGERRGDVVAVLYVGKGSDLRDIGHDWAGEPDDVLGLAQRLQQHRRGVLGLLTPAPPEATAAAALRLRWPAVELPVAQVHALEPQGLVHALEPVIDPALTRQLQALSRVSPDSVTEEGLTLVQRLFGPAPRVAGNALPLPLCIWGLDSM